MKLSTVFFVIVAFMTEYLSAQDLDPLWIKFAGDHYLDDIAYKVKLLPNGGFVIAGAVRTCCDTTVVPYHGTYELTLTETDSDGNVEWHKCYGDSGVTECIAMELAGDGGFIVAGKTDAGRVRFLRFDSEGTMVGSHTPQWIPEVDSISISILGDEGYALFGDMIVDTMTSSRPALVVTDTEGNMQWYRSYSADVMTKSGKVVQMADGGFFLSGELDSYPSLISLVRTDSNGDTTWTGTTESFSVSSVQRLDDNGLVLTGYQKFSTKEPIRVAIQRHDAEGSKLWLARYKVYLDGENLGIITSNRFYGISGRQTSDSGFIIAGNSGVKGSPRGFVLKINGGGEKEWSHGQFIQGITRGYDAIETDDNGYLALGTFVDSTIKMGSFIFYLRQILLAKYPEKPVGISNPEMKVNLKTPLKIVSHYNKGILYIRFSRVVNNGIFSLYTSNGRLVHTIHFGGKSEIVLDFNGPGSSALAEGMYIAGIKDKGREQFEKVLLMHY